MTNERSMVARTASFLSLRISMAGLGEVLPEPDRNSVLRSNGVWLPQLGRVVANKILPTSKRKGRCCHGSSLSSFMPSLFVDLSLFPRSEFGSLRLSLPHNLADAQKPVFDQKAPFRSKSLSDLCFSDPAVMSF